MTLTEKEMLDWIRFRVSMAKTMNHREWICEAYGMAEAAHVMQLITDDEFLEVYEVYRTMITAKTPEVVNGICVGMR